MNRIISLLLLTSILIGCAPQATPSLEPVRVADSATETDPAAWWRDAVFYEIFVRSFKDSNEDGIGDFNGITDRLNYLQELGVNALWLMPIHPSPSYHGYDVLDYYAVNPQYGTMEEFKNLVAQAHQRDIKIIIDLVLNHTSSQHPFFVEANKDPASSYRDWYVWSDNPGNHWHQGKGGYYYGFFWEGMPDLNYLNPDVTDEMMKVTGFWLEDVGIDGFRIDAAKHLIEEGDRLENTPATHEWFKVFYTSYKAQKSDAYAVGEIYGAGAFLGTKYRGQLDHIFNFELASGIMNSVNGESNSGINSAWTFTLKEVSNGGYATFLTNHDQNRVMSVLNGNEEKAKLAAIMLLTSPGTPFIYYGEEIGMQGKKPDEDIRLPMQWSTESNAGFSTGNPWRALDTNYTQVNVAAQIDDTGSLLNLYRTLTKLRAEHPVLQTGSLTVLDTGNTGVYAILRANTNEYILVLINLKGTPVSEYGLSLTDKSLPNDTLSPLSLMDTTAFAPPELRNGTFTNYKPVSTLAPYQAYIIQLK